MRPILMGAFAALLGLAPAAWAETVVCDMDDCTTLQADPDVVLEFGHDDEFSYDKVIAVIDDILGVSGLTANFQLWSTREVDNAAALIDGEVRYLAYNPDWLREYQGRGDAQWILYAIMAHEIGHHLQGHTLIPGGSRPPTELEADEYAGFTLAGLGATEDQALALWRTFSRRGSSTHPPRDERLAAVKKGYDSFFARRGTPRPPVDVDVDEGGQDVVISSLPPRRDEDRPAPADSGVRERTSRQGEICEGFVFEGYPSSPVEANTCVSSARSAVDGNSFGPEHLFDGDWDTAWAEGVAGDGVGSAISMEFPEPRAVRGIVIVNGFIASQQDFIRNGRIREVRITASNGSTWTVDLLDTDEEQYAETDLFPSVSWIEAEVTAVYPGSRYPDLAVTEWRFDFD